MFNKAGKFYLYFLLVSGFYVATSNCLPDKTTLYAANKQVADTDDVAAAQRFEKVFEQVVDQVKPAVVSITSVKVVKPPSKNNGRCPTTNTIPNPDLAQIGNRNKTHSGISGTSSAMIFLTNFSNRGLLKANIRCRDSVQA